MEIFFEWTFASLFKYPLDMYVFFCEISNFAYKLYVEGHPSVIIKNWFDSFFSFFFFNEIIVSLNTRTILFFPYLDYYAQLFQLF